jgi:hypothetical protein
VMLFIQRAYGIFLGLVLFAPEIITGPQRDYREPAP